MGLKEDIRSVTYLKSRAAQLLEQINKTRRPVVITQKGQAKAVIQDAESYERMRNALGILKLLAQGEEAFRQGEVVEQNRLFEELEKKLNSKE